MSPAGTKNGVLVAEQWAESRSRRQVLSLVLALAKGRFANRPESRPESRRALGTDNSPRHQLEYGSILFSIKGSCNSHRRKRQQNLPPTPPLLSWSLCSTFYFEENSYFYVFICAYLRDKAHMFTSSIRSPEAFI